MEIPGNELRIKNKLVQDKSRVNDKASAKTDGGNADSSGKSSAVGSGSSEQIALSSKAREIQKASELAKSAPDIRVDKVERIKQAIADGSFRVDSKDLAGKMLRDVLTESKFLG
jgi:negative regulator of flagellin synthesis FlgM